MRLIGGKVVSAIASGTGTLLYSPINAALLITGKKNVCTPLHRPFSFFLLFIFNSISISFYFFSFSYLLEIQCSQECPSRS